MLLTITTTHRPATDLGYLLHKNPAKVHSFELSFGKAHLFYPEATEERCTAALLLEVDPVGLVRGKGARGEGATLAQYVNDRPYVLSSFTSVAIGRASDFFGPGVLQGSTLGERVFGNALAGRRADFIGNPDLPHTYSYVPDIAAGLATLGTDARAAGQVWHLPGPQTVTTRALLDLVARGTGHPVGIRPVPKLAVRALGLVNPMMRELAEMAYEFDEPFVLDTSKYQSVFGASATPLADAIAATLAWYRTRPGTP